MSNTQQSTPTRIELHQQSRELDIIFDDGSFFKLPCEYLRVFSPAAEVKAARNRGEVITGKQEVNITRISPVGGYAMQIEFDDGHDRAVYSFSTLFELGRDYESNREQYLEDIQAASRTRDGSRKQEGPYSVKVLYFTTLVEKPGLQEETVEVPDSVHSAGDLLTFLHERGPQWKQAPAPDNLQITLNRQFESANAKLNPGDEVGLVPKLP